MDKYLKEKLIYLTIFAMMSGVFATVSALMLSDGFIIHSIGVLCVSIVTMACAVGVSGSIINKD